MRFGQHDGTGDAFALTEAVKQAAHGSQSRFGDSKFAKLLQPGSIGHQPTITLAIVQITNQMQSRRFARNRGNRRRGG